jgi:hypothetical protein
MDAPMWYKKRANSFTVHDFGAAGFYFGAESFYSLELKYVNH